MFLRSHRIPAWLTFKGLNFNPDYPFLSLFQIQNFETFLLEALCLLWYLLKSYILAFIFNVPTLYKYLRKRLDNPDLPKAQRYVEKFMNWFDSTPRWIDEFPHNWNPYIVVFFSKKPEFVSSAEVNAIVPTVNQACVLYNACYSKYGWFSYNLRRYPIMYPMTNLKTMLCELNNVSVQSIPPDVFKGKLLKHLFERHFIDLGEESEDEEESPSSMTMSWTEFLSDDASDDED